MLLNKALTELDDNEFLVKYSLIYLNMRKIKDESINKILENEDNKTAFKSFESTKQQFMLVKSMGAENITMSCDAPNMEKEGKGKKSILIVKTVSVIDPKESPFPNGIAKDVVFMELGKPILDNLLAIC
jgi:hypothetical protein